MEFKVQCLKFQVLSLLSGLVLIILFASCDSKRVYEKNVEIGAKGWYKDSLKTFEVTINDINISHNILINVRNNPTYPFYNLYLRYFIQDSSRKEIKSQQIELVLMDPKSGRPLGKGLGDVYDHQFELLKNFTFPKKGKYYIILKQYMRQDPLPDILSAGVRVEHVLPDNKK